MLCVFCTTFLDPARSVDFRRKRYHQECLRKLLDREENPKDDWVLIPALSRLQNLHGPSAGKVRHARKVEEDLHPL